VTDLLEAGEVPQAGKVATLLRLHGLNGAIIADEEFAFAIGLLQKRKPLAIRTKPRVPFNELRLTQTKMRGDAGNLGICQADLTWQRQHAWQR
jgi:hypothetical protein